MKTFRKFEVKKKVKDEVKVLKINAKTNEVNVGQMCLTITLFTIFLFGGGLGGGGAHGRPLGEASRRGFGGAQNHAFYSVFCVL